MKKFFRNKWFKRAAALIVVAAVAFGGFAVFNNRKKTDETQSETTTAIVARRNIENTVTGSGTVEAYETYNIVPTVTGDIVFCDVEEGDWVEEGQILYKFDTEKSDNAINKAQNSVENSALNLESAQENVNNLTIKAPAQGVVSNLSLAVGDKASGTVCNITDNTYMITQIPVSSSNVSGISIGDKVTVGIEKYMTTVTGVVDRKSSASAAGANGSVVTEVDVVIENPGSIAEGTYCTATFHSASGDIEGAEAAQMKYPDSVKATAEQSGTVAKINVKNGDWVNKGDVIAVLENSSVTNQLKSAKMNYSDAVGNLSDTKKEAEDYVLTAPISGKVLQKNYKKGDTVAGTNSTTLMVVADTTKMKFTINVDELDVSKITVGQEVAIEADAIEGEVFTGRIETVSHLGTSSSGVTYYPVDVVIEQPGDLIPGMNVSAEIIVESAQNVIAVPSGAVSYYSGKYYVTVVGEVEGMTDNASDMEGGKPMGEMPTGDKEMPKGEMPTGEMMPMGDAPEGFGGKNQNDKAGKGGKNQSTAGDAVQNMYSEPMQVEVTTGVSDDDYIEIVTGLSVGQIVNVTGSSSASSSWGGMGGMNGAPMGNMGAAPMGGNRGGGGGAPMGGMR